MKRLIRNVKPASAVKYKCAFCYAMINANFMVRKKNHTYHLTCYRKQLINNLAWLIQEKKELHRELNILKKHNAKMILEGLR